MLLVLSYLSSTGTTTRTRLRARARVRTGALAIRDWRRAASWRAARRQRGSEAAAVAS